MSYVDRSYWPVQEFLRLDEVRSKAEELRAQGKKIVTMNGSFDIVHAGHLNFIGEAAAQGDVLIVGVNSDKSVKEGKGESRPYIGEVGRAGMIGAVKGVDVVAIVDESYDEMPIKLIEAVKPDVHVNGSEYGEPETWLEWEAMQVVGAKAYVVERREGLSTTELIEKIKQS